MQGQGCGGKPPDAEHRPDTAMRAERTDSSGATWRKVYTGGGAHFRHWLEQFKEIYGEENLTVDQEDSTGFACFEQGGEQMYSIWLRLPEDRP
jgi:hypothetical protein